MEETRKCPKCGLDKLLTKEFWHQRKSRKDGWEYYCKECVKNTNKNNYYNNIEKWNETSKRNKKLQRERINEVKNNLKCLKCGENRNHLLDFHHIDPSQKDFQISQGERYGWKKIKEEIDKCVPLCSNCHRDFHHLEKTQKVTIEEYINQK